MKQLISILLGLSVLFGVMHSCGGNDGPAAAFMRYANDALEGDYAAFSLGFCRGGRPVVANDSVMLQVMNTYKASMEERFQGLRSVEVVRDSIYEGGRKADVRVRLHFGNGVSEETEYEMCRVDDQWMISLDM